MVHIRGVSFIDNFADFISVGIISVDLLIYLYLDVLLAV